MTRQEQFAPAHAALDELQEVSERFDASVVAVAEAQFAERKAFDAYNPVSWKLQDHSGASDEDKIDAEQKKIAYDKATQAIQPLMNASTNLSQTRGAVYNKLLAIVQSLLNAPGGSTENIAVGTGPIPR